MHPLLDTIILTNNAKYPVDIEYIVRSHNLEIDYFPFDSINGTIIGDRIVVNNNLPLYDKRFVLAHEFCHHLLHESNSKSGVFGSADEMEKRADEFATILLLPEELVKYNWNKYKSIEILVEDFQVPYDIVRNRLIGLNFV